MAHYKLTIIIIIIIIIFFLLPQIASSNKFPPVDLVFIVRSLKSTDLWHSFDPREIQCSVFLRIGINLISVAMKVLISSIA